MTDQPCEPAAVAEARAALALARLKAAVDLVFLEAELDDSLNDD